MPYSKNCAQSFLPKTARTTARTNVDEIGPGMRRKRVCACRYSRRQKSQIANSKLPAGICQQEPCYDLTTFYLLTSMHLNIH